MENRKSKILCVCRGNFARSQFALEFFRRLYPKMEVKSAGTRVIGKDGNSVHGQKLYEVGDAGIMLFFQ